MFDLEANIRSWRLTLSASLGPDRPDVIDELEAHLRDEFDRLVQTGEAPERAWPAAAARVGAPEQLAREFAKLGGRRAWLPARLTLYGFVVVMVVVACVVAVRLGTDRYSPLIAAHVLAISAGYLATFAVGAMAAWSVLSRAAGAWGPARATAFRAAATKLAAPGFALTLVGVMLGAWWASGHLGRAWGWDAKEVGGLAVLLWNLVTWWAVRRHDAAGKDAAAATAMAVGVAGNVVVSLAWFGPPLIAGATAAGQRPQYGPYLLAFLAIQIFLLIALASAPAGRVSR